MRRQGERPELIRWRLCGTSKTWSFVPQDENAPRPRTLLVVSELTLSLMLLIGAGLLIRSFVRLQSVPPGFTTDRVLTMEVAVAGRKYQNDKNDKPIINFYKEIESRVAHLPGVVAEGVVSALPLTGEVGWGQINVEGYAPPPGQELQADIRSEERRVGKECRSGGGGEGQRGRERGRMRGGGVVG